MKINKAEEMIDIITSKVKELLETNREIAIDEDLASLGLDSLTSVALIVDLEDSFDIEFEDEELLFDYFSTIQKIINKVSEKMK